MALQRNLAAFQFLDGSLQVLRNSQSTVGVCTFGHLVHDLLFLFGQIVLRVTALTLDGKLCLDQCGECASALLGRKVLLINDLVRLCTGIVLMCVHYISQQIKLLLQLLQFVFGGLGLGQLVCFGQVLHFLLLRVNAIQQGSELFVHLFFLLKNFLFCSVKV